MQNSLTKVPHNPFTGTVYKGNNRDTLSKLSECVEWATFIQWNKEGFKVREGEKGAKIFYFTEEAKKRVQDGSVKENVVALKTFYVFNRTQVEKI